MFHIFKKNRQIEGGVEDFFDKKLQNSEFFKLLIFHIFKKNRQIEGRFDDF